MSRPTEPGWYWYLKPGLKREMERLPNASECLKRKIEAEYKRVVYVDFDKAGGDNETLCGNFPGGYIPVEVMDRHGRWGPRVEWTINWRFEDE